jgi:hypothetical protein
MTRERMASISLRIVDDSVGSRFSRSAILASLI